LVGRVYGYRLLRRYGSYLHLNESRIKIGQYLFLRHGGKVVFFARFVAVLRSVAGILAGANRMPWPSFIVANVAGAVAWVGIYCIGAYLFGEALTKLAAPVGIALGVWSRSSWQWLDLSRGTSRSLQSKPSERCLAHASASHKTRRDTLRQKLINVER
jgi:membrane protein DedA with SNARE-associated domain